MISSHVPLSVCGVKAGTRTVNSSIGPVTRRPSRVIASTCSTTVSTMVTSWPARARYAPSVPPIAPAPQIRDRIATLRLDSALRRVAPRAGQQRACLVHRDLPQREHLVVRSADTCRRSCRRRDTGAARPDRGRAPAPCPPSAAASSGMVTPGRRVHGKFSIHEPCDATGSIACTLAHVRGAFHQLWKSTRQPGDRRPTRARTAARRCCRRAR